jgi:fermentation-respiration switch protein FrsA (DUF1100 family)
MPQNEPVPGNVVASISPRPILLIAGEKDTPLRGEMMKRLYLAAHEPKEFWIVPNAPHGSYARAAPAEYPARLQDFYTKTLLQ